MNYYLARLFLSEPEKVWPKKEEKVTDVTLEDIKRLTEELEPMKPEEKCKCTWCDFCFFCKCCGERK